jgi:DNA-binding response OmpR family regulator
MALVVVAEDDEDVREWMCQVLRRAGHEVLDAPDGQAALSTMWQRTPDVAVLDVDMPRMDGLDLRAAVRADPYLRDVPVVFATGKLANSGEKIQGVDDDVLVKPFSKEVLLAHVDSALQRDGS